MEVERQQCISTGAGADVAAWGGGKVKHKCNIYVHKVRACFKPLCPNIASPTKPPCPAITHPFILFAPI